jgi:hypothetical protein
MLNDDIERLCAAYTQMRHKAKQRSSRHETAKITICSEIYMISATLVFPSLDTIGVHPSPLRVVVACSRVLRPR